MSRLTQEDVDVVIGKAINTCVVDCKPDTCHCELVRDLAYATIEEDPITVDDVAEAIAEDRQRRSLESVRSEALMEGAEIEAARIALHAAIAMNEGFSDKWYEERWGYVDALCSAALQSPARVAEGGADRPEIARALLQKFNKLGHMEVASRIVDFVLDRSAKWAS